MKKSCIVLFQRAVSLTRASPKVIITDHLAAYEQAIATFYPNAEHYCYKDFTDDKSNNTIEAFNKTFKGILIKVSSACHSSEARLREAIKAVETAWNQGAKALVQVYTGIEI